MRIVECADCGEVHTNTPQFYFEGMPACAWCMNAKDQITDEQLHRLLREAVDAQSNR